jgi:Sec-independent protein translocase protein TatA
MVPVPGLNEFVMLVFVALCVFGAGKLPAIATAMGKALWRLRRKAGAPPPGELNPVQDEEEDEEDEDEEGPSPEGPNE